MNEVNYININKKRVKLLRNEDETNYEYNLRKNCIKRMKPKTKKAVDESIRLSYIYSNIKILGCVYPDKLQDKVMKYDYNNKNRYTSKFNNNK